MMLQPFSPFRPECAELTAELEARRAGEVQPADPPPQRGHGCAAGHAVIFQTLSWPERKLSNVSLFRILIYLWILELLYVFNIF